MTELPASGGGSTGSGSTGGTPARRPAVLAPAGSLPPLGPAELEAVRLVGAGDLPALRALFGAADTAETCAAAEASSAGRAQRPDPAAVHPESGAGLMHMAAVAWGGADLPRGGASVECAGGGGGAVVATGGGGGGGGGGPTWRQEHMSCHADQCGVGGTVNHRAFNGSTPLHWAAGADNVDAVGPHCLPPLCCLRCHRRYVVVGILFRPRLDGG